MDTTPNLSRRSTAVRSARIALILLCLTTVVASAAVRPASAESVPAGGLSSASFSDVPADHPFATPISWLIGKGITTGYDDGTYRPTQPLTRQTVATFLYRTLGAPKGPDPSCSKASFDDVAISHPFCGEIDYLTQTQWVIDTFEDHTFRPTIGVDRQSFVDYLYRIAGSPDGGSPVCAKQTFTDVPTSHPLCGKIAWAAREGIVGGYADGTFKPGSSVNRQNAAAFLYRFAEVATDVATGKEHSCALLSNAQVRCWGSASYGQLGNGTAISSTKPVDVKGLTDVRKLSTTSDSTCALRSDHTVACWGLNDSSQLGDGTTTTRYAPVTVAGISNAIDIASGAGHTCVVLESGQVKCWGYNYNGQIGDGTTTTRATPVTVTGVTGAVQISAGLSNTCVVLTNGTAKCWGNNSGGQIGDGTTTQRTTATQVGGLSSVRQIETGKFHSCAALTTGTVKCWGGNGIGQLGDGTTTSRTTPVAVSGVSDAVEVTTGAYISCARLANKTARCWGQNADGQLGDGTVVARLTPVAVHTITDVRAIDGGGDHACAVATDAVYCWGANNSGQVGDGTKNDRSVPTQVNDLIRDLV